MGLLGTARASAQQLKVLLVDDVAAVLEVTRRVLERAGYLVMTCTHGQQALAALAGESFDVMVSDIEMPGISGLKLLRAVREHDLDLPVILMTGNPGVQSAADAVEYGAYRYLIKPVPSRELSDLVSRAGRVCQLARSKREYVEEFGSGVFRVGDRAGLDATLDRALGTLSMVYQPIVRATDSTIFAYEALMRVGEPMLPHPGAVLQAAERAARLNDVGRAVRERVIVDATEAAHDVILFVNLHPRDLLDETLFLRDTPFAAQASRVVLEITERASLDNILGIQSKIAALRALGFQIALDDLGAGYAGLTSFTQLEPEFVKLDMALIRDVDRDAMKQKIIRSMVQLCTDMGKRIIAEGIESRGERDMLVELGCDLLQGYFFAKPGLPFPLVSEESTALSI